MMFLLVWIVILTSVAHECAVIPTTRAVVTLRQTETIASCRILRAARAVCSFPSGLQSSNWVDSDKGVLQFNTTTMSGWAFKAPGLSGTTIQDWECYFLSTDGNTLILKATTTIVLYSKVTRPFLCMSMTSVTDYSYYYYLQWAEQVEIEYERITVEKEAELSGIVNETLQLCLNQSDPNLPSANEYHMLVKQGNEIDAIQDCPSTFFGKYNYTVSDLSTGNSFCDTGNGQADVCTDKQRMTFDYTACSTLVAYSANGSVFCLATITTGVYTLNTVYDENSAASSTDRFTCFMSSISGDGSLSVSQSPGSCTKDQTPNTQPALTNGTTVGLNVQLTPTLLCPITTTSPVTTTTVDESKSSASNTAAIVGGTVGAVAVLAALTVLLICLYLLKCRKQRDDKETSNESSPIAVNTKPGSHTSPSEKEHEKISMAKNDKEEEEIGKSTQDNHAEVPLDIDAMPHMRYPHWIHRPQSTAPIETQFSKENGTKSSFQDPPHNPFLLPPLRGKKVTLNWDTSEVKQNGYQNMGTSETKQNSFLGIRKEVLPNIIKHEVDTTNSMSPKLEANTENMLPDNPLIVQAHFDREDMKYVGQIINVTSRDIPGPDNDYEFKEKLNSREATARSVSSIELKPSTNMKAFPVQSFKLTEGMPEKNKNAIDILPKSKTLETFQNKSGIFYNENVPVVLVNRSTPVSPNGVHNDETSSGKAYDEDDQKARELGQYSEESFNDEHHETKHTLGELIVPEDKGEELYERLTLKTKANPTIIHVKELTQLSYNSDFFLENEHRQSITTLGEDTYLQKYTESPDGNGEEHTDGNEEERTDGNGKERTDGNEEDIEDINEGGDIEDIEDEDIGDAVYVVDRPGVVTAMKILYGDTNEEDPDKMNINEYELLNIK